MVSAVDPYRTASRPPEHLGRVLVAADFHLDGSEEARVRLGALLDLAHAEEETLLILGDLFHYWFGPRHLELDMYARELDLLAQATARGTPIHLIPGNRDFLLDRSFTRRTGISVGGDLMRVRVGDEWVHFSHGDLFSTSDLHYQAMRHLIRSAPIRLLARVFPAAVVDRIAARLRSHSERVVSEKSLITLDPDISEVFRHFREGNDVVICGHFHRFRDEQLVGPGGQGRFIVLEPFENDGAFLRGDGDGGWTTEWVTT
ncbi:MAG: metallophosphoesterase [Planctomycetota bacterium]